MLDKNEYDSEFEFKVLTKDNKSESVFIPDYIMERLYGIGIAYNLHRVQQIDPFGYRDKKIDKVQIDNFLNELTFIETLVNDEELQDYIKKLINIINSKCFNINYIIVITP